MDSPAHQLSQEFPSTFKYTKCAFVTPKGRADEQTIWLSCYFRKLCHRSLKICGTGTSKGLQRCIYIHLYQHYGPHDGFMQPDVQVRL